MKILVLERATFVDSFISRCVTASFAGIGTVPTKVITFVKQKELPGKYFTFESLALGGRSRINGCLHVVGRQEEYEEWGEGWKWEDVIPYFTKIEGISTPKTPRKEEGKFVTRSFPEPEYEGTRWYLLIWITCIKFKV